MSARYGMVRLAAAVCVIGGGLVWALGSAVPAGRQPAPGPGAAPATLGFAGSASCSAQACHGRAEPLREEAIRQNEYTHFLAYDKHAQAYEVLTSRRARRIAENLAPTNPGGKAIPAHEDVRCLACHTTPQLAVEGAPVALRKEGVGCEACHGPANRPGEGGKTWLTLHTAPSKWRDLPATARAKYHFTDLSDLASQAKACAGCHVGAPPDREKGIPARDCNHDIMAAGHPRLNFELTVFRANLPPHWDVARKHKGQPGTAEAAAWAVGQVASARAALQLLAYRARQAEEAARQEGQSVRWPEFAEYRCFACHADLNPAWRIREQQAGRQPGALPYDPWYWALLPALHQAAGDGKKDPAALYAALAREMARPLPDTDEVAKKARALAQDLDAWLERLGRTPPDAARVLKALAADTQKLPRTWERSMQLTLALAALKHGELVRDPKSADLATLKALAQALAFPDKSESPAGLKGPLFSRDADQLKALLDPKELERLEDLKKRLNALLESLRK